MARIALRHAGLADNDGEQAERLVAQISGGWMALTFFLAAVAVSLYLVQVSSMASAGYELQRLEAERDVWLARNEQLQYELAKRRSLPWVEAQATERLGLVRPDRPAPTIQLGSSTSTVQAARMGEGAGSSATQAKASSARVGATQRPSPEDPVLIVAAVGNWIATQAGR